MGNIPQSWYSTWWPPKVGDKLRHFTHHSAGDYKIKHVHALVHVVAVFDHEGDTLATVAEWFPGRQRWNYETIRGWLEAGRDSASYWQDGQPPPKRHGSPGRWCGCCKDDE